MNTQCPLCDGCSAGVFLERAGVPVFQNVVCTTRDEALRFPRGDLRIALCGACGFVFNAAFDPSRVPYSAAYDNSQTCSPFFQQYLRELAARLTATHALEGKRIVEVGCGKGDFLRLLCAGGRNRGLGYDPSYVGPDAAEGGAVRFVRELYGPGRAGDAPDFVCCRHVIEHVPRPLDLLRAVRAAIGDRPDVAVYFETPELRWILDGGAFWDFFYEHCSYFTAESLAWAFGRAGFEAAAVRPAFGGQYLALEARPVPAGTVAPPPDPAAVGRLRRTVDAFRTELRRRTDACDDRLRAWAAAGGCAVWGAASKGVTLVNTMDRDGARVRFLVDLNPAKQGKFVPGTGHAIAAPEALRDARPPVAGILNMNPNYADENRARAASLGVRIPMESL